MDVVYLHIIISKTCSCNNCYKALIVWAQLDTHYCGVVWAQLDTHYCGVVWAQLDTHSHFLLVRRFCMYVLNLCTIPNALRLANADFFKCVKV